MTHRPWVVLKYGGTSVASARAWASITDRVRALLPDPALQEVAP